MRVPQERRRSCRLHRSHARPEIPGDQLQAPCRVFGDKGRDESPNTPVVPPSEGNEAKREGRQEVVAC